jgi:glucokinase
MKYAIGIDIGGTKISAALGNHRGKILAHCQIKTLKGRDSHECIRQLIQNLHHIIQSSGVSANLIKGIGVCLPGAIDTNKGIIPVSPHLEGWKGIPLARMLFQTLKLPVRMANDANAAALAEKVFGQGQGVRNFIYMTVSTGVGGGIVIDGKLLTGTSFVAGEIGHMTIDPFGEKWKLGEIGVLEAYASGTAVARYVSSKLKGKHLKSLVKYRDTDGQVSAKRIAQQAKRGDRLALEAFGRAGFYLGIGVANLLNVLNPRKVILGGGMLESPPPVFWKTFRQTCRRRSWKQAYQAVRIVRTKLGNRVGNLGALALVFEK